jgi:hypothetical protein
MNSILRLKLSVFIALASFLFSSLIIDITLAAAADKKKAIIVMGESQVKSNLTGAREAAVADCLKTAVESAAIGELAVPLLTEKFHAISNLLADRKDEFIQDYKVLQESKSESLYRVLVQVTVSTEKIQQAMSAAGITAKVETLPQVLFLVAEQRAGETSMLYWWQKDRTATDEVSVTAIKEIFQSKGMPVINPQLAQTDFLNQTQLSALLTDEEALELGKRFFADAVVVGTAIAQETSNRMGENIRPVKGAVNVRLIFTQTGEKSAPIEVSATVADKDPSAGSQAALSEAGKQAGEKLAAQLIATWEEMLKSNGEIALTIKGRNVLANLNEFRNALKNTAGVTNQRTLEIASDKAVLSVTYQGKSQELADAILLQTFKDFGINIYEVTAKNLNIEMTPK